MGSACFGDLKVIGGAGRKRKLHGEGKGGSEPPKAADIRFLIESRSAGVLGGELILGRAAILFSIQKIPISALSLGLTLIVWALFVTDLVWGCQRKTEVGVMEVLQ